jgi:hypothetical protein
MPDTPPTRSFEGDLGNLRRERLKPLMHDIDVSRAVDRGSPCDLYQLLLQKSKASSLANLGLIKQLLKERRLFAEPVERPPTLFMVNGIGTTLYGRQQPDASDGTYIGTLFLVFFLLPVFPLGQYLVRPSATCRRGWYFLAKVPLDRAMRLWQQLAALAAIAALLAIAIAVLYLFSHGQ